MQDNQEENPLPSEEGSESSRQGSEQNLLVEEGVSVNREQEESSSCSSRVNSGRSEWLKILSEADLDVNILCQQSRSLLESTEALVANRADSRQSILQQIVPQLVEHEKNKVTFLKKKHQQSINRASYHCCGVIWSWDNLNSCYCVKYHHPVYSGVSVRRCGKRIR